MTPESAAALRHLFAPGAEAPYTLTAPDTLSLHFDFGSVQSRMAVNEPDRLVLAYTRAMMGGLLFNPWPQHIAMIGLGGGSLLKYCYRYLPWVHIRVAEIDPRVIALRETFHIPADDQRLQVHEMDGAEFIRRTQAGTPDLLLVDGFGANGLPAVLSTMRFYDDCHALLADNGVLVANLSALDPEHELCIDRLQHCFDDRIVVIRTDDGFNKIVFALKGDTQPTASSLLGAARELSHQPLPFRQMALQIISSYRGRYFLTQRKLRAPL